MRYTKLPIPATARDYLELAGLFVRVILLVMTIAVLICGPDFVLPHKLTFAGLD